jgi:hypothetical protein
MMFSEGGFFVSAAYFDALIWPAVGLAAVSAGAFIASVEYAELHPRPEYQQLLGLNRFSKWVLAPAVLAWWAGWMFTMALPNLMNKIVGEGFAEQYTVKEKHVDVHLRGGQCHQVFLNELKHDWNGKLCVRVEDFNVMQAGRHLRLYGTRSWFGTEVRSYALLQEGE